MDDGVLDDGFLSVSVPVALWDIAGPCSGTVSDSIAFNNCPGVGKRPTYVKRNTTISSAKKGKGDVATSVRPLCTMAHSRSMDSMAC